MQIPGTFSMDDSTSQGLLPVHLRVCHTLRNRNNSYISQENMEKALPTLFNRPILGNIIVNDDGVADFHSHDMIINDDGSVTYIERPIGVFPESCDPKLVYDEEMDKTYVEADGYIYEDYGNQAASILKEAKKKKVSCELTVNEMSYNAKEKYLEITDFYFNGVTVLGTDPETGEEIGEGMVGSNITLKDFSQSINSYFSTINTSSEKNGGDNLNKFEELLAKYNVKPEDITFEYDNLSDEELEKKFQEEFSQGDPEIKPEVFTKLNDKKDKLEVRFEISHEDIRSALYNLIEQYDELDNDWYFIRSVYDDYFVFEGWINNTIWGQNYTRDGDNVSLSGERWELFQELLTATEKAELENMRANYTALQEKVNTYEAQELHAERESIMNKEEYSVLFDTNEYKELYSNMDQYSAKELDEKLISLIGKYALSHKTFSAAPAPSKHSNKISLFLDENNIPENPFKTIFSDSELKK